ncbi:transcription elongation factor GreB [mine drainage metagenome]|jgi:transcription elongation factor GreB|uniref:Transcription elongation factor GreA n=1 Tax=mine drainage metagenome TaxID=410659 RepID=A0A1J5R048_9ZZZZ
MSKAFTRETDTDDDDDAPALPELPAGTKNYITPAGYARLRAELKALVERERPQVVETVSWAASNGDRSENGDYIYGKKRLREIDRRIRFLGKRLDKAEVVDPARQHGNDRVYFGATVRYLEDGSAEREVTIVGIDEVDLARGAISWISPVARVLLKSRVGDVVQLPAPGGVLELEVLDVYYPAPS